MCRVPWSRRGYGANRRATSSTVFSVADYNSRRAAASGGGGRRRPRCDRRLLDHDDGEPGAVRPQLVQLLTVGCQHAVGHRHHLLPMQRPQRLAGARRLRAVDKRPQRLPQSQLNHSPMTLRTALIWSKFVFAPQSKFNSSQALTKKWQILRNYG